MTYLNWIITSSYVLGVIFVIETETIPVGNRISSNVSSSLETVCPPQLNSSAICERFCTTGTLSEQFPHCCVHRCLMTSPSICRNSFLTRGRLILCSRSVTRNACGRTANDETPKVYISNCHICRLILRNNNSTLRQIDDVECNLPKHR